MVSLSRLDNFKLIFDTVIRFNSDLTYHLLNKLNYGCRHFYLVLEDKNKLKRVDLALQSDLTFSTEELVVWNAVLEQLKKEIKGFKEGNVLPVDVLKQETKKAKEYYLEFSQEAEKTINSLVIIIELVIMLT